MSSVCFGWLTPLVLFKFPSLITWMFWFYVKLITSISEYLELEEILTPETDATLRKLLRNPIKRVRNNRGSNGRSMRKFRMISGQMVRPGYSSESQFACRHCGKRYRWKSTLRRHEQVECGDKEPMFQCPKCPYRAKQKGNLGVHLRKHHGGLLQAAGFASGGELKVHSQH